MSVPARTSWRRWRCGALALLAVGALWRALAGPTHALLETRRAYPLSAPGDIAHRLADFSTLPQALSATPGSWRVEEERGDISTWRYRVRWACGARCAGEARVQALAPWPAGSGHAPPLRPAGSGPRHRVELQLRVCIEPALFSWSDLCDEMEISAEVVEDGAGGAVLQEKARATCGESAGATRGGGDGGGDDTCSAALRHHRSQHHDRIAQPTY